MKKSFVILLVMLFATFAVTSVFAGGPAEKATGDISYIAGTLRRYAKFAVFEDVDGRSAKGFLRYSDFSGGNERWYEVDVRCVIVVSATDMAYMGGQVTSANIASWIGNWSHVAFKDGGEPAAGVDKIWGIFAQSDPCASGYNLGSAPGSAYIVDMGNLQVHTYGE